MEKTEKQYKQLSAEERATIMLMCQSAPHSFQLSAFGNSQRAAYNQAHHQHDWQKIMLFAGKNSALIDTEAGCPSI